MAGPNARKAPITKREPVAVVGLGIGTAITGVVAAGVALINAFQPGAITDAQQGALTAFVGAVWLLLGLVWVVVRRFVWSPASHETKVDQARAEGFDAGQANR